MRTIVVLIVLILLMASVSCLWSQQFAANTQAIQSTEEKPVTLVLTNTPLPAAMAALFKGTELTYAFMRLAEDKQGDEWWNKVTVSVNITNVPFRDAIRIVARAAGLNIKIRTPEIRDVNPKGPKSGGQLVIGTSVSKEDQSKLVDYFFSPSMQSSNQMINQSQIQQTNAYNQKLPDGRQQDANNQRMQGSFQNNSSNTNPIKMTTKDVKSGKVLNIQLEQANVFDVISQLMSLYNKNYILDLGPSADLSFYAPRVTARMSGVTLDEFLGLLKTSSGVQVEEKDGQIVFRWRPDPRSTMFATSLSRACTVYYLYLLLDSNVDSIPKNVLNSLEDGPSLALGNTEYVNWLKEKTGLESAQILIAGSVSNDNTLYKSPVSTPQNNLAVAGNMSVRVGPVSVDGMEFKASLFTQITTRNGTDKKVRMALTDRLYWRRIGTIGDTRSFADRIVEWPMDRTRLVRTESIAWPNGSKRMFILVASVSPLKSQDLWPGPNK